jgi:hypothetical protein
VNDLYTQHPPQATGDVTKLLGAVAMASTVEYHLVCGADNFLYKVSQGGTERGRGGES